METLERGLEVIASTKLLTPNDESKLKKTVTLLIKENQILKKEAHSKVLIIEQKDKDL